MRDHLVEPARCARSAASMPSRGQPDDRRGDRQRGEQAGIVRRRSGAAWRQIVRPQRARLGTRPSGLLQPACRALCATGLIPVSLPTRINRRLLIRRWLSLSSKRLERGKPIGGIRPAAPRAARHGVRSVSVRTRPLSPPSAQLSPSASANAIASRQPAVAIALQRAPPARAPSSGSSSSGNTSILRFSPITATESAPRRDRRAPPRPWRPGRRLTSCLPLRVSASVASPRGRRTRARRTTATSSCVSGRHHEQRDDLALGLEVDESAAPARRTRARRAACRRPACRPAHCRREQQQPVGGLGVEMDERPVALAPFEVGDLARARHARCIARIQPRCDRMTVIGSFSIIADQSISRAGAGLLDPASAASSPNLSFERGQVALQPGPLPRRALDQLGQLLALLGQRRRAPCAISISSSLRKLRSRMLRIASAWRSVSSNSAIITGLGSSSVRMISITRSRLRKAIRKPSSSSSRSSILPIRCWRAADQHLDLEREPGGQRLLEAHHPRRARLRRAR